MTRAARILFLVSVAGLVVGLSKVHAAWVAATPYDYTGSFRFGWSLAYVLLLYVVAYGVGLPDLPKSWRGALASSSAAAVLAALGVSSVQLVTGDALLPRFVVFGSALGLLPVGALTNRVSRGGADRAERRDRVVVVGDAEEMSLLAEDLDICAQRPAIVVGHLSVPAAAAPGRRRVVEVVEAAGGTVLVLSRAAQADEQIVTQAATLHEGGVRVRTLSLFYEEWLGKIPVAELERMSLMFDIGGLHRARYGRVKRVVDVALGLVGLVPLVLVLPVVAALNLVGNRGPLLYRQERVGRFGRTFPIVKLRTMRPDREDDGAWTAEDDPRITPLGRILRASHLDELPQVLNILRGDLSVVGPRPEQPRYVAELSEKLPFYGLRHLVRPGLTGWAQVTYGYSGDEQGAMEKLQYEFFYLRHQRLSFDLRIVGRTIRSVRGLDGR